MTKLNFYVKKLIENNLMIFSIYKSTFKFYLHIIEINILPLLLKYFILFFEKYE